MLDPVALVTGASRRIGAAIATYLHQQGFRVLIHCHQSCDEAWALADALNQQTKARAQVLVADLSLKASADALIQDALAWAGSLHVLVNNASLFSREEADWDRMFALNVKAPFWLSQAAFPALAKTEGSIINITDTHADVPLKGYALYCQTKAALAMQTKALAQAFAPSVRVNAVAPGAIAWPEGENTLTPLQQQRIVEKTPLKRHGDPVFIAQAVFALADNRFITGQTLKVDGGRF